MTFARKPITIVEIDIPTCTHVFGTAPCTAALSASVPNKCFNMRATCADPTNYDGSNVLTLRFAQNLTGIPKGRTIFPALKSCTTRPSSINLSGLDPRASALGTRARITVNLNEFPYHDGVVDPYRDGRISGASQFSGVGYDPATQGLFLTKLARRNPYYVGQALRVLQGYAGDALGSFTVYHYVISEWKGPDAGGNVTITAKDILDLAENDKAVAPAVSQGVLLADITDTATTATLTPTGIGADYAASGRVCIGREVMTYTIAGDVLTFLARGVDGTVATTHSALDLAQECLRFVSSRKADVIRNLLVGYAGVPSSWITLADWQDEEDTWSGGQKITATITKPTGVASLIGEICQLGVMVWEDPAAAKIRFRCNRPLSPGETVTPLTDDANIIEGTMSLDYSEDQRISDIFVYHGMIDPTDSVSDARNFTKCAVATVEENLYGQAAHKEIFTRWFGKDGDDRAAASLASRLLGRYQDTPRKFTAALDIKDMADVEIGAIVSVQSYLMQDVTGLTAPEQMQVSTTEVANDRVKFTAETYATQGRFGFYLQNPQTQYDTTATADDIEFGAFYMDAAHTTFPDGTGPFVYY